MSTMQRIHARTMVVVNRKTAGVLRAETKKVLMFEHDLFEDFLDFSPEAQQSLALRYCNASDLITTLGWDPEGVDSETTRFEVALSDDLIGLLRLRLEDLALTNVDRLADIGANEPIGPDLLAEITVNRLAIGALTHVFGLYEAARATAT
jgi:hypothetical protein